MSFQVLRTGGYTPSEEHLVITASNYRTTDAGRVIMYMHGAGGNGAVDGIDVRRDLNRYADRGYVVCAPLAGGGVTWGNSTGRTAIDNCLTYLGTTFGAAVTQRIHGVGDSHGAALWLNWAVRNPNRVGGSSLRVPAIMLQQIHDANTASLAAGMETAFGGLAGLVAAYPTHDPMHATWQATYAAAGLRDRVRLLYNPPDPIIPAAYVESFGESTGTEVVPMLGPSHAPWGYFDIDDQLDYLRSRE